MGEGLESRERPADALRLGDSVLSTGPAGVTSAPVRGRATASLLLTGGHEHGFQTTVYSLSPGGQKPEIREGPS